MARGGAHPTRFRLCGIHSASSITSNSVLPLIDEQDRPAAQFPPQEHVLTDNNPESPIARAPAASTPMITIGFRYFRSCSIHGSGRRQQLTPIGGWSSRSARPLSRHRSRYGWLRLPNVPREINLRLDVWVAQAVGLMDKLRLEKAHVVGNSSAARSPWRWRSATPNGSIDRR